MGSSSDKEEFEKELQMQLADVGKRLSKPPSSVNELLVILRIAEIILCDMFQAPPKSIEDALSPTIQALISDELLRHSDVNVQVGVASCLGQIIRITILDIPFSEELMKEICQLFMVALKHLPGSGRKYIRAEGLLHVMTVMKLCLIIVDLELDAMVVELFKLFFDTIRSNQSAGIVKDMELVMSMMINESDEVPVEYLTPLLDSVRMENKNISPVTWKLGKAVFENCATHLRDYLPQAVKHLNLDVNDYATIVASICNAASNGENMVVEEVVAAGPSGDGVSAEGVSKLEGIYMAEQQNCTPRLNDGNENINENSTGTLRCSQQIVQFEGDNARPDAELEVLDIAETGQPETEMGEFRMLRRRKPNTLMRPEEGYQHTCTTGWSTRKRSHSCKRKSSMIIDREPEQSMKPRMKTRKSGVKQTRTKTPKKTEKAEGTHSGTDSDNKEEFLHRELAQREEINDEVISQKTKSEDDEDKMADSPVFMPASKDSDPEKEKKSWKSSVQYGEELVNARISVWWPLDETFYTGTVESFEPSTKKHKIKYDDDEEEILNLEEERWEFFNERNLPKIQSSSQQEADDPSRPGKPVKTKKKTSKRKASKPQRAASSSKRAKTEVRSFLKPGKSTFRYINLNENSDDDLL